MEGKSDTVTAVALGGEKRQSMYPPSSSLSPEQSLQRWCDRYADSCSRTHKDMSSLPSSLKLNMSWKWREGLGVMKENDSQSSTCFKSDYTSCLLSRAGLQAPIHFLVKAHLLHTHTQHNTHSAHTCGKASEKLICIHLSWRRHIRRGEFSVGAFGWMPSGRSAQTRCCPRASTEGLTPAFSGAGHLMKRILTDWEGGGRHSQPHRLFTSSRIITHPLQQKW